MKMAEAFAQKVRKIASEMGEFTVNDIVSRLPAKTYREKRSIKNVIGKFRKRGEAISLKPGLYCYRGSQTPLSKTAKMWRAIRIKGDFTRRDLTRLSGATEGHARKYIFFLKREGFISRVEIQRSKYRAYRLVDPEKAPLEHPKMPV